MARDASQTWTEQQERLLFAAQTLVQNANEHEEARDGERVTTVDPDDFRQLQAVVQEIHDDAVRVIQQSIAERGSWVEE